MPDGKNLEIELRRRYHRVPLFTRLPLYHRVRNSQKVASKLMCAMLVSC